MSGRALLIGLGSVIALGVVIGVLATPRTTAESTALARQKAAASAEADEHTGAMLAVWATYDALPASKKTPDALQAAAFEAIAAQRAMKEPLATQSGEFNRYAIRERGVLFFDPEARAEGERLETLVPTTVDVSRCRALSLAWLEGQAQSLSAMGFKELRCGDQRWPLPPHTP